MTRGETTCIGVLVLTVMAGIQTASAQPETNMVLVTARPSLEPYRLIGGRTAIVPLTVHAPEPEGLTVRAELVQLGSALAMPLAGGIVVPLGVSAQPAGVVSKIELSVPIPAVSRETDFELRFRSFRPPEGAAQAAGRIALRVYPANLLEPVRVWAESHAIRLEDDRDSLAEFFREQRIAVTTRPGPADLTVYAGPQSGQSYLTHEGGQAAILFSERETTAPHLVVERTSRGTTVKVEMRLLDRLLTDPLAQKILLEAFQHAVIDTDTETTQGVTR